MRQRIIPVVDLLEGRVVRGIAGRRSEYRPIVSPWSNAADPVEIVRGIQSEWGLNEFYVADLDGIQHDRPDWSAYKTLNDSGVQLLVDCGVRDIARAVALVDAGVHRVILALETLDDLGIGMPRALVDELGTDRVVFSLDLMHGQPLARGDWRLLTPLEIVQHVVDAGVEAMIVLDLAAVGGGGGIPTLPLCREMRQYWPALELITGGGVRDAGDCESALESGVDSVLVASALHDRRLTPQSIAEFLGQ